MAASSPQLHPVFVYGSLKRGYALHPLLAGQKFAGTAATFPDYRLFDLGEYPGLIEVDPGSGQEIAGEVYHVRLDCLARLDDAEGVAEGLYVRRPIRVAARTEVGDAEQIAAALPRVDAWFYLGDITGKPDCGCCWPRC